MRIRILLAAAFAVLLSGCVGTPDSEGWRSSQKNEFLKILETDKYMSVCNQQALYQKVKKTKNSQLMSHLLVAYTNNLANGCIVNVSHGKYPQKVSTSDIKMKLKAGQTIEQILKPIIGRPVLELLIERLQRADHLDKIVVATTINDTDESIISLCEQLNVKYFRGSEDDVLKRVLDAAKSVSANIIVEITGDCPFVDPDIVDEFIQVFLNGDYDYVSNTINRSYPIGFDVQVFPVSVLEEVNTLTSNPVDHEHVSIYIYEHPERYRLKNIESDDDLYWPDQAVTLDTQEDYELICRIFEELYPQNPTFSASDVVKLLRDNPELVLINEQIKRKNPHGNQV